MTIACIILAGGEATRMGGGDKPLLSVGGETMLTRIMRRLAPQVDCMAISANGDPARFASYGLPVLADRPGPARGPLAGILEGLEWASSTTGCELLLSVPGDAPFLPADLVDRLRENLPAGGGPVIAEGRTGLHPTFGLWPVGLRVALSEFLETGEKERVRVFAMSRGGTVARFATQGPDPFMNVNTPDDLQAAALLASKVP